MKGQAQHPRRDHRQQDVPQLQLATGFALVLHRLAAEMDADQAEQPAPEHHDYGQDRPQLDNDFKGFGFVAGKAQPLADDDHMPGGRNRQKFG